MTHKSITQAIISSLVGKTITEARVSERGVVSLGFKSGDKLSLELNSAQTIDYLSRKPKVSKTEKLVQHGLKALEAKPKTEKIKRKRVSSKQKDLPA